MSLSAKSLLLSTLVLAGGGALHGQRPLIVESLSRTLGKGSYNNNATRPWVLTVRDGKAWISDPMGAVDWRVGRTAPIPPEYASEDTWLELDPRGALVLWERVTNIYSGDWKNWERWRLTSPANGIKAIIFQDDGKLSFTLR
ncbi:hypothetical protein [Geothrix sp. 21YS21S-2]|uniref:hypothetical protein n=1 Tax=Geothrix sp. 21YS21S-2 TaxID=3068893 RepID=UPI0027BA23E2|nr:hypothetical protein [Geothrix sp. 21YS21S-2]